MGPIRGVHFRDNDLIWGAGHICPISFFQSDGCLDENHNLDVIHVSYPLLQSIDMSWMGWYVYASIDMHNRANYLRNSPASV